MRDQGAQKGLPRQPECKQGMGESEEVVAESCNPTLALSHARLVRRKAQEAAQEGLSLHRTDARGVEAAVDKQSRCTTSPPPISPLRQQAKLSTAAGDHHPQSPTKGDTPPAVKHMMLHWSIGSRGSWH